MCQRDNIVLPGVHRQRGWILNSDRIIGWDIGGAHVKAAQIEPDGRLRRTFQVACPLWRGMEHLHRALDRVIEQLDGAAGWHAVTMTGEMVDIFANRSQGVHAIIDAMVARFGDERVMIFAGSAGYLKPAQARHAAGRVASANWQATACWASAALHRGLLVDIGSTTTDLIPFSEGALLARGRTDRERLRHDELVYTGIVRTPLMALARRAPINGEWVGVISEHFATSADIYRILSRLPEGADQYPAADQGDKSPEASERRLARMLGMDAEQAHAAAWYAVARYFQECQIGLLMDACMRILSRHELGRDAQLVGAGVGRFLARALAERLDRQYIDFNSLIDSTGQGDAFDAADCAPAVSVAALMQRKMPVSASPAVGIYA